MKFNSKKIVILSGAGISSESGLPTYRDGNGIWKTLSWQKLASPEGWSQNPEAVLNFYNERRAQAWQAHPNAGHAAIAALESAYEVVVVTQNVDALHERAGSTKVIHLHGQLAYARGTSDKPKRYRLDNAPIALGQLCADGTQLRPDVVWFGEQIQFFEEAHAHVSTAAKFLVVGTSLSVFPAALLVNATQESTEKVVVSLDMESPPFGFSYLRGKATEVLPQLTARWLDEAGHGR